jgi:hypothetical protein
MSKRARSLLVVATLGTSVVFAAAPAFADAPAPKAPIAKKAGPRPKSAKPPPIELDVATPLGSVGSASAPAAPVAAAPAAAPTPAKGLAASPETLWDKLPKGELKTPTKLTVPAVIPKGESVDGVYVEVPEYILKNPTAGSRYAQVFSSKEDAKARNTGQPIGDTGSCFMSASPAFNGETEVRWNGSIGASVAISPYPKSYSYGGYGATPKDMINVMAVRADRLLSSTPDHVTLDSRVVYVDAQTLGARLVSEDKVDFALIKELPGRVRIYGAKSNDQITFLVKRTKHPAERFPMGGMFVQQGINGGMSSSDECHITFTMPAKASTAATAILQLETVLDIKEPGADDDKSAVAPAAFEGPAMPGNGMREGHIRTMEIGFSSTFMSQDKSPVISLTNGWLGRERIQQM